MKRKQKFGIVIATVLVAAGWLGFNTENVLDSLDQPFSNITSSLNGDKSWAGGARFSADAKDARRQARNSSPLHNRGTVSSKQKSTGQINITDFGALPVQIEGQSPKLTNPLSDPAWQADLDSLAAINQAEGRASLRFDASNKLLSVTGEFLLDSQDQTSLEPGNSIVQLVQSHGALFGFGASEQAIINEPVQTNSRGETIWRLDRTYQQLPVWGRQVIVTAKDGVALSVMGNLQSITAQLDISAQLESGQLAQMVDSDFKADGYDVAEITDAREGVYIYANVPVHAYRVTVEVPDGREWVLFFAAKNQVLVSKIPQFFDVSTPSSGTDLLGVSRSFNSFLDGSEYLLLDQSFPQSSDTRVATWSDSSDGYPLARSGAANSGWDPAAVSAINNAKESHNYFLNVHGRSSFDGQGSPLIAIVNHRDPNTGGDWANATWSSGVMRYGTGGGSSGWNNVAIAKDVAAHEFSHGVVQYTSNLAYQNQSGALNESYADFFGAMVDRDDWYMGEDLYTNGSYLRDMVNPASRGQPGHMDNFVNLPNDSNNDYGGVHINSGIPNRALYLIAEGLTAEGRGTSIGKEVTESLAYATLQKLSSYSEFIDSANTMILEAASQYGTDSQEHQAVVDGWAAVGVTTSVVISEGGNEELPLVTGDDVLVHLVPRDGTMDNLGAELYDVYVQTINQPFSGHMSSLQYGPLNDVPALLSKPTAYTLSNGLLVVIYVGNDGKSRWSTVAPNGEDTIYELDSVATIASSPSGDFFALVQSYSNQINLYRYATQTWEAINVVGPSYSQTETGSNVQRVDAINFDSTGQKIIFDYEVCIPVPDQADCVNIWSIGIYDVGTDLFEYPFSSSSPDIDIGFPQFANTRNDIIAMDYMDWTNYDTDGRAMSNVIVYDLANRVTINGYETNLSESYASTVGVPSFVGNDVALVMQAQMDMSTRLWQVSLDENFAAVADSSIWHTPFDSGFGQSHRNAYLNISAELIADRSSNDFGVQLQGDVLTTEFTLTNSGNRELLIKSLSLSGEGMQTNLANTTLLAEETIRFKVSIDTAGMDLGPYSGSIGISHSGDNADISLGVSTFVDADFDADGIVDSVDEDDDNDGVADVNDAFPNNSDESLDTDGDGIGNNADSDDDNDGIEDFADQMPLDADEIYDTDGDGIGNNADMDDDNDGVHDSADIFPLNDAEAVDTDGDGVGDNADSDDDNDGLQDSADVFSRTDVIFQGLPFSPADAPLGLVEFGRSYVTDPNLRLGRSFSSWVFDSASSYYRPGFPGVTGTWVNAGNGVVATSASGGYQNLYPSYAEIKADFQNINWQNLSTEQDYFDLVPNGNIGTVIQADSHLMLVEKTDFLWRFKLQFRYRTYLDEEGNPALVQNSDLPILDRVSDIFDIEVISPDYSFASFSQSELQGSTFMLADIQLENPELSATCEAYSCADTAVFHADGTGKTLGAVRNFDWSVTSAGVLSMVFADTGTSVELFKISNNNDSITVLSRITAANGSLLTPQLMVKRTVANNPDISDYLDKPLSSGFYVTNLDSEFGARDVSGLLIDNFVFVLNADYSTGLNATYASYRTQIDSIDVIGTNSSQREVSWSYSGDNVQMLVCYLKEDQNNADSCVYRNQRSWQLIHMTPDRLYVLETLAFEEDFDRDGVWAPYGYKVSRPNLYELADYDLNDVDRDGVANSEDAFVTDPNETIDSDGDGVGNNTDSDDDNDGVQDSVDQMPLDASEIYDTDADGIGNNADTDDDGDGVADNADLFPMDGSEWLDTDGDGIGNNADTDDDNDGLPDAWELAYGLDPLNSADAFSDADNDNYTALEEYQSGSDPTEFTYPPAQLVTVEGLPLAVKGQSVSIGINYSNETGDSMLTGLGLRLHFDSSVLSLTNVLDLLPKDLVGVSGVVADTSDYDSDPETDSYIVFSWASLFGDWPNQPLPATLVTLQFDVSDQLDVETTLSTPINFTASSTAEGYRLANTDFDLGIVLATWDFDLDGQADALTDGLLFLRHTFGLRGDSMIAGVVSGAAQLQDSVALTDSLDTAAQIGDVDGDGRVDALTDGLLLLRYLFGLRGDSLVNGVVSRNGTRTTAEEIESHLGSFMP